MKNVILLCLSIALFQITGCTTTLRDVEKEVRDAGFILWYPAQANIKPGQIWRIVGNKKDIVQLKPQKLITFGPSTAKFKTLTKRVNANITLDAKIEDKVFGDAGDLSAQLKKGTVKSVSLEFGATKIEQVPLGQLRDKAVLSMLPESYRTDLERVRLQQDNHVILAGVLTTSGMTYIFTCEDTAQLKANAPEISKILDAKFDLNIVSKTQAVWEIKSSERLAIGISPINGDLLKMNNEEVANIMKTIFNDRAALTGNRIITSLSENTYNRPTYQEEN